MKTLVQQFLEYIPDAYAFAKERHDATGAIRRSSGKPYIVHPTDVANIAIAYGGTDEEVEASLLHDTVEDTDTTIDELENRYSFKVARIVHELTNDKDEIDKLGKEMYMNKKLCSLSKSALFCKLCDIYDNMADSPGDAQKERMINNILYLLKHRKLDDREAELVDSILMAA